MATLTTNNKEVDFEKEIDRVFELQKQNRWKMAYTTPKERIERLKTLLDLIEKNKLKVREAVQADYRKPAMEADMTEVMPSILETKFAISNLREWMEPQRVGTSLTLFGSDSEIRYEPKGNVFIIGPWNYPFQLVMVPLASAIAAGNCVIIKPSSDTVNTSNLIMEMLNSSFPENEVYTFVGGIPVTTKLLEKPFDHIFFTGSPRVGKIVMESAAKHLASVTLELGGKCPAIIDETANLEDAAEKITWGKFLNGGQTCVGVDYALVHESKYEKFIENIKKYVSKSYGETPEARKSTPDLCRIINDKNFQRIKGYVDHAKSVGGKIETGGDFDAKERYISPTIISNVSLDFEIMQDEIFGPVLPILTYKNLDETIEIINSKEKPLALYIFSEKEKNIDKVIKATSSGATVINSCVVHLANPHLPFGGVNHSGIGNYHGLFGFKAFSHERAVLRMSKFSLLKKLFPPYTSFTEKLVNFMMKYL